MAEAEHHNVVFALIGLIVTDNHYQHDSGADASDSYLRPLLTMDVTVHVTSPYSTIIKVGQKP